MSSDKAKSKKEKKLRKFQDTTQTPLNRIKFLAEYTGAFKLRSYRAPMTRDFNPYFSFVQSAPVISMKSMQPSRPITSKS